MKEDSAAKPKCVMVLSAAAATGHLRAADALVSVFQAKGISAPHVEVLRYTNPLFRKIYSDLYVELMTRGPDLLGWLYKTFDRPWQFLVRRPRSSPLCSRRRRRPILTTRFKLNLV